jgi:uncharacterized protein YndB with AHSA1/START domain
MPKTNLHQQVFIDALPSKVWKVLTNCHYVNQYLFDETVHCRWTEGSTITLNHQTEERTQTVHKGHVLEVIPGVSLKYKLQEKPASIFITITYELMPAGDGIELKFHSEGFNDENEQYLSRMQETKLLLQKIKWLAEYA